MHIVARFCRRLLAGFLLTGALAVRLAGQNTPPTVVTPPASQTANAGARVEFSVVAEGTPPLSYQWYVNGLPLIGAVTNSFGFFAVQVPNSGLYTAVVGNAFGSVTSAPAVLTVIGPPFITAQPTNLTVFPGQTANFSVTAFSPAPLTYQWQFQGTSLTDATNQTLIIANVTTNSAGNYTVQIVSTNGSITSRAAILTVSPLPPASLRFGTLTITNRIQVPVLFTAHGTETNLSFSASWSTNIYRNASFEPSLSPDAQVTTDESRLDEGLLGAAITWPTNELPPGESLIGQLVFDLVSTRVNPFGGLLAFGNVPVPAVFAPPVVGTNAVVLNGIQPQLVLTNAPVLNRQTGFMEQLILFANPGAVFATNARLTVANLGTDSRTNVIRLGNSQGLLLPNFLEFVDFGAIAPAEIREGLLQYYVSTRTNVPSPTFNLYATPANDPLVLNGTPFTVTVRNTNDMVLVEFPTRIGARYYIQYTDGQPPGPGNTNAPYTSLPAVGGTGSNVQWVDSGPPRTVSWPVLVPRFYYVLEVR